MNVVRLQPYFLLALLGGAFVLAFFIFKPFLAPLILAAVFAAVVHPVYKWILAKLGGTLKSIASLITVLLSVACVVLPLFLLGVRIVGEAEDLYASLADGSGKAYLDAGLLWVDQTLATYVPGSEGVVASFAGNLDTYAKGGLTWLIGYLGSAFSSIAILLLKLFIFLIALYYFLRDGGKLKQKIIALSPLVDTDDQLIFSKLNSAVHSVVRGTLAIAIIQGVLTAVGFMIFGVPNAILWGSLTAIAALIPGIGTALVIAPAVLYLFVFGNVAGAVGLLLWGMVAVGLIDNFLGPKLMGHGTQLHPLVVMLSVLGGIAFFGPMGIFVGPLSISFLFALISIYSSVARDQIS